MLYLRRILFPIIILFFSLSSCSNNTCVAENGRYQPVYEIINGTCGGDVSAYTIPMEYKHAYLEMYHNRTAFIGDVVVTTQIQFMGCSMVISQDMDKAGTKLFSAAGEFDIASQTKLVGEVNIVEFGSDGNPTCNGRYKATLIKSGELVSGIQ